MSHLTHHRLAIVLAITVALGPFAIDAYLPAFQAIALDFDTGVSEVGLTLSVYVIAMALGQLIGGPLSDRFGRARILFSGLALFAAGSLLVAASQSLEMMMLGRILQAFGGGWSTVNVPAIVRDRTEGNETARLFSLIAMIMFIAPAIAPSIGTLLMKFGNWHAIFVFLALYAVFAGLLLRMFLFHGGEGRRATNVEPLHRLVTNYVTVLRNLDAMRFVAIQALAMCIMLVYLTHASFIYQEWLGYSNAGFSVLFAANVIVMMIASLANRRLLMKWQLRRLLALGLGVQALAIATLATVVFLDLPRVFAIPALALAIGSMGAIAPNNMAGALQYFRALAGTAAALMGSVQFAFSGMVSTVSALVEGDEMEVVVFTMAGASVLALSLVISRRRPAKVTATD